jgi:Potential Queuosine, Q, salvage protein family
MSIVEEVRACCAEIAANARSVRIDLDAAAEVRPATPPPLDHGCHYLEGEPGDVADYMLALDTINFGSGWFPTLRKRELDGRPVSGYFTVSWALADHVRAHGPPTAAWLSHVSTADISEILGQHPDNELMSLYAQALRSLGRFLAGTPAPLTPAARSDLPRQAAPHASSALSEQPRQAAPHNNQAPRRALDLVAEAGGSAVRLAEILARGMAMFDDRGFYKRAQILPSDLALAGVADFADLDRLTIFADNLVPHVLRCDGVLVYDDALAARIDGGAYLPPGGAEREIRACALHACELISGRTGVPARAIDTWLWTRGQSPVYKARPRHRCRNVFY